MTSHSRRIVFLVGAFAVAPCSAQVWECQPEWLGSLETPHSIRDVAVSGGVAYVADDVGLRVVDVSDALDPVLLGELDLEGLGEDQGRAAGVAVQGTVAYVAARLFRLRTSGELRVLDVTDATNPRELGSVELPRQASAVAVSRDIAYVAAGGLFVIDVANPANPEILSSVTPWEIVRGVTVSGDRAYLADGGDADEGRLHVIDVRDPESPTLLGSVVVRRRAIAVALSGDVAYVAGDDHRGLQVVDVSNPRDPTLLGAVDTPDESWDVAVSGHFAVVAGVRGISIFDIASPKNPTLSRSVGGPPTAVAISEDAVYAAEGSLLQVLNISSCSSGLAPFRRGDGNDDGGVDMSDAVWTLSWLFLGGAVPPCLAAANFNADLRIDVADSVLLLNHLFLGGPPPQEPFPQCGTSNLQVDRERGCDESSCH